MRILLAEDEKDLNEVIVKTLEKTDTVSIPVWMAGKHCTIWRILNMMRLSWIL